jgi:hypothetical protein
VRNAGTVTSAKRVSTVKNASIARNASTVNRATATTAADQTIQAVTTVVDRITPAAIGGRTERRADTPLGVPTNELGGRDAILGVRCNAIIR